MNIHAVNSSANMSNCQPIRSKNFGSCMCSDICCNEGKDVCDTFTPSEADVKDLKLDLACRLAALNSNRADYYRDKYEKLREKTGCYA